MKNKILFLKQIAFNAGKKILETKFTIVDKKNGGGNWVTQADLVSEQYILKNIKKYFPNDKILSEETKREIKNPESEESLWVVDPLDGTTNATFNIPFFVVSIAYIEKGKVIAGVIYDPNREELFYAEKEKGAFLNNKPITVQKIKSFENALVNVGSPYSQSNFTKTYPFGEVVHQYGGRVVNFSSAALELAYVSCGRLSMYFEIGLKPWDVAAGSLLIEEAGGVIESLNNSFSIFNPAEVFAGNKEIVKEAKHKYTNVKI
jgi:myo-inositol-1(or 4)-monophosphatase